jgi:pimeloyl-ACP methyl ester carboxylesterase
MVEFLRGCDALTDLHDGVFDDSDSTAPIQLVLGGYSYGSWICTHLPDISEVMKQFCQPIEGNAAAEVNARARHLATQTNLEIRAAFAESRTKHAHTLSVGGEETSPEKRRRSGESSPSRFTSEFRKSLDFARKIGSVRKKHYEEAASEAAPAGSEQNSEPEAAPDVVPEQKISVAYLLISPLLPPISAFTTLPFGSNPLRGHSEETLCRLASNPTLAVFANNDSFTSAKKLRLWSQDLSNRADSKFQFVEIDCAGHFWRTHQVQKSLMVAIGHWTECLLSDGKSAK